MNQQAHHTRFSSRADHYARHRPGYPRSLYAYVRTHTGLGAGQPVADIGSGTGLLSRLFLDNGHPVFGIEPNQPMRQAADIDLVDFPNFHNLAGAAEAIPLDDASVNLLVAGQSFHWFNPSAFKAEAQRVLAPMSQVALIWNRRVDHDPFVAAYEALLDQYAIDYYKADPKHRMSDEKIAVFFDPAPVHKTSFPNPRPYDWQGIFGLAMSQSYVPPAGHPNHAGFLSGLKNLFEKYQRDNRITLALDTHLYFGPIHNHER